MALFRCASGSSGGGATITVTYSSSFYGETITCTNGTKTYSKVATSSGTVEFAVDEEGTWTITCDGVSRTVNVVLNYTTQMAITKTVTVYGAAGATISFTDTMGSKTCTLDNSGEGSVSITFIPPSQSITFTDTNVSKNPDDLSQNYSKSIAITESTTSIKVMPDNALYWYGWNGGMENASPTNGWVGWSYSTAAKFANPTWATNYVYPMATGSNYSAVGNSNPVRATKIHSISEITSQGGINVSTGKSIQDSGMVTRFAGDSGLAHYQSSTFTEQEVYIEPFGVNSNGRGTKVYALWYE